MKPSNMSSLFRFNFRKSTIIDKKQSALLFIESNELINLKETIKGAIDTGGFSSISL